MRAQISKDRDLNTNINIICAKLNDIEQGIQFYWHKNCYSSFTSSKNITVYKKFEKLNTLNLDATKEVTTERRISRSVNVSQQNLCIFCQKRSHNKKLCQVMTINTERKI